jgi:hypothetical protein
MDRPGLDRASKICSSLEYQTKMFKMKENQHILDVFVKVLSW